MKKKKHCVLKISTFQLLYMKLTFLMLIIGISVSAAGYSQKNKLNLSVKGISVPQLLKEVEKQTKYTFLYKSELLDPNLKISLKANNIALDDVLKKISELTSTSFTILENDLIVFVPNGNQQKSPIRGKVTDSQGQPLPGATILIKGTKIGTTSDADGNFLIKANPICSLIFSYMGFVTKEVSVNNQSIINISLEEKSKEINEVVVVGYGVQKKVSVVGSVSSVSSKDMLQTPAANISNTLTGRLPGLITLQTTGDPGRDAATLLIRGKGTYTGNTGPLVLVDGVVRTFNTIDANEVENITILKDASATAVYGIRGANGVLLVTTRRGSNMKPVISFTANTSLQQMTQVPEMCNSYEYATLKNEAYINEGKAPFYSQQMLDGYKNHLDPYLYPDVDWYSEFLKKNSLMHQYNLNVTGGSNLVKYFVSSSYLSQDGAFNHTKSADFDESINFSKYNFRSNLDFDFSPTTRLSVNLGVSNYLRNGPYTEQIYAGQDGTTRIFSELVRLPPNCMPVVNPDGSFSLPSGRVDKDASGIAGMNLLAELTESGVKREYGNLIDGSVILKQKLDDLIKGLTFSGNFSMRNGYTQTNSRYRPVISGGAVNNFYARYPITGQNSDGTYIYGGPGSSANQPLINYTSANSLMNKNWYFESKLDYIGNTGKNHYTGLLLFNASRETLLGDWPKSYIGISSRATYDYDYKYLAEINLGYNGSENFAPGNRFGLFPALALGWLASNEAFLKDSKIISLLKIRGSFGEVGNDQGIGRFAFFNKPYANSGSYSFGLTNGNTISGYNEGAFGNSEVQWEVAKKYNLGLDAKFFNNIIGFTADVFYEMRDHILASYGTVPATLGVTSGNLPSANLGKMENKGYEVELTHNYTIGNFGYWIKANLSFARNKILFEDEPTQPYPWLFKTGNPVDQLYGLRTNGFFKDQAEVDAWYAAGYSTAYPDKTASGKLVPGDFKYVDQNGDKIINNLDMVPIGGPTSPEYQYAVSFGGKFKNLDFSAMFQGSANTAMFVTNEAGWAFLNGGGALKIDLNRWTPATASTATSPRVSSSPAGGDYNYVNNDYWIKDASYLRLKQAQIGYTIVAKNFLRKISLQSVRIYIDGSNLCTFSKIKYLDPENRDSQARAYPQQRVFNFGINVTL
ncbi:MAG: TonB-dependent receptor [Bacteroidota bacterium]|nr:TonB-dependent receptor [Bacteroidota bacterium]